MVKLRLLCEYYRITTLDPTQENVGPSVTIFPNPFNDQFQCQIETKQSKNAVITMYNSIGATIMSIEKSCVAGLNQLQIPACSLPQGVYMVSVSLDGRTPIVKRIVKK